jgi:hypothetical protein
LKKKYDAERTLFLAHLTAEKMQKNEEVRLKAATDAAEVVKKNEINHLKRQSN